jgi:hypothetical protein
VTVNAGPKRPTAFGFVGGGISLPEREVTHLLRSLHDLHDRDAESVAEEIEALILARVRVDLRPTEAETGALVSAITRILAGSPGPRPHLSRMLTLVRGA